MKNPVKSRDSSFGKFLYFEIVRGSLITLDIAVFADIKFFDTVLSDVNNIKCMSIFGVDIWKDTIF